MMPRYLAEVKKKDGMVINWDEDNWGGGKEAWEKGQFSDNFTILIR
jgi:hypothetical protein